MKPQAMRVIAAVFLLIAFFTIDANESAVYGCDYPALQPWGSLYIYTYEPNANVHVFIDSRWTVSSDRFELAQGIKNWSSYSLADCSGVTFYGFESMDMSGIAPEDLPPAYTVWVIRQDPDVTGIAEGPLVRGESGRIVGQKIKIRYN